MKATIVYRGKQYDISSVIHSGKSQVKEFIDGLPQSEQKKIVALLRRTADHGILSNEEKFRKLDHGIWEFKSFQVRLLCFFERNHLIVLTHGFKKKQDRTPKNEIERAVRIREELRKNKG